MDGQLSLGDLVVVDILMDLLEQSAIVTSKRGGLVNLVCSLPLPLEILKKGA